MRQQRRAKAGTTSPGNLIDTNVLIRFLIGDDPDKAERAMRLMERVERGAELVEVTAEVLTEAVWTLERVYKVPRVETADKLAAILGFSGLTCDPKPVMLRALEEYARTRADFVDCMLTARAEHSQVTVYTFDVTDFRKLASRWKSP